MPYRLQRLPFTFAMDDEEHEPTWARLARNPLRVAAPAHVRSQLGQPSRRRAFSRRSISPVSQRSVGKLLLRPPRRRVCAALRCATHMSATKKPSTGSHPEAQRAIAMRG